MSFEKEIGHADLDINREKEAAALDIAVVEIHDDIKLSALPFIKLASPFPSGIRETLTDVVQLSNRELESYVMWAVTQNHREGPFTLEDQKNALRKEIGKGMLRKLEKFLSEMRKTGEAPEGVGSVEGVTREELKKAADDFIKMVKPVLINEGNIESARL